MARDEEGLPTNLSPLELGIASWLDENGIHIAIFKSSLYDGVGKTDNVLDRLDEFDYVITVDGVGALKMAEKLFHMAMDIVRASGPMSFDVGAPAPFPPDARHRIYARERGMPLGEHGGMVDETTGATLPMRRTPVDEDSPIWKAVADILGKDDHEADG